MNLKREKKFINDLSKARLSDSEFNKMIEYFSLLANDKPLPPSANDHALSGEYTDTREFHIGGDKLVIYLIKDDEIRLLRIGTHAQLFK
ncbi:type II toxin-antitoxin system YafQ family toxin [Helicobacter sp. MIT 01-3238]|uniref:type II toxin-antitoxin system RelE/ParE family toxin n=1 Tax=Helicobacter sp. MIT 01-3238 TaxID=398627 RepID=UPI000E1F57DD|nr:type II toxin-antitoxin system YafQ family toxin [Helicobacter sp. MIT 01-3238]RDU52636.1 type II toxin-antitoxin system mRNA interferase toxin, RelE/StbE family [Helicobacter sp. MIT 01-3238]